MLNLRFGGAVVYAPVSSSCAECKLFEIRGSIFHVGDPNYVVRVSEGLSLFLNAKFVDLRNFSHIFYCIVPH